MKARLIIDELFKGVAVVIDDEVNDTTANIQKLLDQISSLHIPVVKYVDIPPEEEVSNFQSISFVFLDWRLIKTGLSAADLAGGVSIPNGLEAENSTRNVDFIKRLYEICYCPVFIFTNEDKNSITDMLVSKNICLPDKPSNILIESKSSLQQDGSLQAAVENWIKINPSIYVLKEWEREYQKCKNRLFFDFQKMSPVWPQVMWKCFDADGGNKSLELGELISRNLHTRMKPFEFNEDLLKSNGTAGGRSELRRVLEGARFLKELHKEDISTGDVFREEYFEAGSAKQRYWLNIRAQCDLLRNGNPFLYCLPGYELVQKDNGKIDNVSFSQGEYLEKGHHAIVPFIDDGKIVQFEFGGLEMREWKALSTEKIKRIGRILPPYITKIQQRFALYLHRQGLPRIPDEAIFG